LLIDFSDYPIFQTATVRTTILMFEKAKNRRELWAGKLNKDTILGDSLHKFMQNQQILLTYLSDAIWQVYGKEQESIINKVRDNGIALSILNNIKIDYGIKTGLNEAFIIDGAKRIELIVQDAKSEDIIKPLLRGRDIRKYDVDFNDYWLINTHNGIKDEDVPAIDVEKDYPIIFQHLQQYEDKLIKRADQGNHWSNLRNCAYLNSFEATKIIYPNMTKDMPFTLDRMGYFTNQKCFIITGRKLYFLVSFLNSKLFRFCFKELFPEVQGNSKELNKAVLETIPVKQVNQTLERFFKQKVDQILLLKSQNEPTELLEAEIDIFIYKLYQLEYSEACLIEPELSQSLSEPDYNAIHLP